MLSLEDYHALHSAISALPPQHQMVVRAMLRGYRFPQWTVRRATCLLRARPDLEEMYWRCRNNIANRSLVLRHLPGVLAAGNDASWDNAVRVLEDGPDNELGSAWGTPHENFLA